MPITFVLVCLSYLGMFLLVPALPVCIVLLAARRRKYALVVLGIPLGMVALPILLGTQIFAAAELHSRLLSACPNHVFRMTFGFKPPAQTQVLKAYHKSPLDGATTAMKFRTTREAVDKIAAGRFVPCDKKTLAQTYAGNAQNLPQRVRSWFQPPEGGCPALS
jgi:hypothetical protein